MKHGQVGYTLSTFDKKKTPPMTGSLDTDSLPQPTDYLLTLFATLVVSGWLPMGILALIGVVL